MAATISKLDPVYFNTEDAMRNVLKATPDASTDPIAGYAKIFKDLVEDYSKADRSEKLADAIDAFRQGIESGKTYNQAIEGISPHIAGSKTFQDRADTIRQSHLAQATFDNQMREQGLKEEANKIALDLDLYARQVGAENAYMWMDNEKNRAKLLNNPYAYDLISKIASTQGLNLKPALTSTTPTTLSITNPDQVIDIMNKLRTRQGELRSLGINANMSDEEAMGLTSLQGFIDHGAKQRGYEKDDGAYSDYSENMTEAFNKLRAENPNVPIEAILMSMKLNQDNGGFWWFDQPDINISSANDHLSKVGKTWASDVNEAYQIKKHLAALEKAYGDGTIANNIAAINTQAKKLKALVDRGLINEKQAQTSLNQYAAAIETNNQALKEALTTGSIFGNTVPKTK